MFQVFGYHWPRWRSLDISSDSVPRILCGTAHQWNTMFPNAAIHSQEQPLPNMLALLRQYKIQWHFFCGHWWSLTYFGSGLTFVESQFMQLHSTAQQTNTQWVSECPPRRLCRSCPEWISLPQKFGKSGASHSKRFVSIFKGNQVRNEIFMYKLVKQ